MANRSQRRQRPHNPSVPRPSLREEMVAFGQSVSQAIGDINARLTVVEHALANVISDIYDDEDEVDPADNGVRVDPDNPANEVNIFEDPEEHARLLAEEAEAARLQAEADWEGDGGA